MTRREEAIAKLKAILEEATAYENAVCYVTSCDADVLDMAIKALNQQAVLDKIRAEIESQREEVSKKDSEDEGLLNYYFGLNDGLKDVRDILDKYRAES